MNFLETIWSIIIFFLFLSYLILLFQIIGDIFRDRTLSGGFKALWVFFLLVAPVITALIYLIVRGGAMAERNVMSANNAQRETEDYLRRVAGTQSPADQIAAAKSLLDAGTITDAEYAQLKVKALA
ncbi:SHOCT domain-containing protein [Arthrobacter cryoconiti]|uniref:PLDc N-terminal domain-containing protein n=1 Tax=Arthrobacter cryoconiti TaxID=748907 RepID=A0ABV8QZP8_9MICC|nr:SHOCT domain-containing protein [Arthrobacter cryoconiti]MCC9068591.1 SHOCT domain-containing protein [Arthrobacter cryoconiti]